jgi:hypothetical protein
LRVEELRALLLRYVAVLDELRVRLARHAKVFRALG